MAREPSIKGTSFESAVQGLRRLVDSGKITRSELERRLTPRELQYLDERIEPPLWYPIASFVRFAEIMCEIEGGGRNEYYEELGRENAKRLTESQVYRQLSASTEDWGRHVARMHATMGPVLYSFGKWTFEQHEDQGYDLIRLRDAEPMAEPARYRILGFIRYLLETAGADLYSHITTERPNPDEILYKIHLKKKV